MTPTVSLEVSTVPDGSQTGSYTFRPSHKFKCNQHEQRRQRYMEQHNDAWSSLRRWTYFWCSLYFDCSCERSQHRTADCYSLLVLAMPYHVTMQFIVQWCKRHSAPAHRSSMAAPVPSQAEEFVTVRGYVCVCIVRGRTSDNKIVAVTWSSHASSSPQGKSNVQERSIAS
jgi:hypothetical protein